jgi:predicted amidohydrolase
MKVCIGQIEIKMGDKKSNLNALVNAIDEAGAKKCDVVVLPECPLAGWIASSTPKIAEPIPGPFTDQLSKLAKKYHMAIVSGVDEVADGKYFNTAVLIDKKGKLLITHRKINELDIGLDLYTRGNSLKVTSLDGITVGVNICADSWTHSIVDALHLMGAKVIFSPCAWAIEPGKEESNIQAIRRIYRDRTMGKKLYIVSANSIGDVIEGPWKGKILQGDSLVSGPEGENLLQCPRNKTALLVIDLPV